MADAFSIFLNGNGLHLIDRARSGHAQMISYITYRNIPTTDLLMYTNDVGERSRRTQKVGTGMTLLVTDIKSLISMMAKTLQI